MLGTLLWFFVHCFLCPYFEEVITVTDRAGGGLVAHHSTAPPPSPHYVEGTQGAGPAVVSIGGAVLGLETSAGRKHPVDGGFSETQQM